MLIDKNGRYSIFSLYPNSDWTDGSETKYVVDDYSDLGKKIMEYGECEFVEDESGNLVDVTKKALPIEVVKAKKIEEMSSACNKTIMCGVTVGDKHYSMTEFDQINLQAVGALAQQNQSVMYHADGEKCTAYSPEEMIPVFTTAYVFSTKTQTYFNYLKFDILAMTTLEQIESVYWGQNLSEQAQQEHDSELAKAGLLNV